MWNTLLTALLCVLLVAPAGAATYFVKASGNNKDDGLSDATAWKTIGKVNQQSFAPGDIVQFRGGDTFTGTLSLNGNNDVGTAINPITIRSYGTERALISNARAKCLDLYNMSHLRVYAINCTGVDLRRNGWHGITMWNDVGLIEDIEFSDMDISGFGFQALYVGTGTYASAYDTIKLIRVRLHDNLYDGAKFVPQFNQLAAFRHIYLGEVEADHNRGFGDGTGNGVTIYGGQDVVVEFSKFHDNGGFNNNNGNYGIYVQDTTNCRIRYSEAWGQKTVGGHDGGGFDIDGGSSNCVVEHNETHDNDGPGYALINVAGSPQTWGNNVIQDNSSLNDGLTFGLGSLYITRAGSPVTPTNNFTVRNNTFYTRGPSGKAVNLDPNTVMAGGTFEGNTFYARDGGFLVYRGSNNPGLTFTGNTYKHEYGGLWTIRDNLDYHTLAGWGKDPTGTAIGE